MGVAGRLAALGLDLPPPFAPVATYQPAIVSQGRIYVSGQGPVWGKEIRYSRDPAAPFDRQAADEAARLTMLNVLSQVEAAVGLDEVAAGLSVFGLVNAPAGFDGAGSVIGAGVAVLEQAFGAAGRCAVSAVTATSLPFDIAVEMDAVFALR